MTCCKLNETGFDCRCRSNAVEEYPEVLKGLGLEVGDKVTVRDKDGNAVRGTVSQVDGIGNVVRGVKIKLLRTAEVYVTDKNIATNGYELYDIVKKPKPWDEAPDNTVAYVGSHSPLDIARKSNGQWRWLSAYAYSIKPKERHFEKCYVELVPKEETK